MNRKISIACTKDISVKLRSVDRTDLEDLRQWKNANRSSFFHTEEINSQQQEQWFNAYLSRPDDFMLAVTVNDSFIGCMGFRKMAEDGNIDVYNIILGKAEFGKKGYMTTALKTMCCYANFLYGSKITVKVLKTNPAAGWYKKNNFVEILPQNDYFYLELNKKNFEEYTFKITTDETYG